MPYRIEEQLNRYLADAHSIEVQALAQLRTAPDIAGDPEIAAAFREHLAETEGHERMVKELLDERGARPTRRKDAVISLGARGFVLFARLQPNAPGKLVAHSLSYEALELASYELLARVADRAGEPHVSGLARQIAGDERQMMHRLEDCFDRSNAASLESGDRASPGERVRKYLADAHAIEQQSIELLERAPGLSDGVLAELYEEHLSDSRGHSELIAERLTALGGDTSPLEDSALRAGAVNWTAFFQAHPDTAGQARRLHVRVRAPRDRRLRAAATRRRTGRRSRHRGTCRADPRRGADRGGPDRRAVRRGGHGDDQRAIERVGRETGRGRQSPRAGPQPRRDRAARRRTGPTARCRRP